MTQHTQGEWTIDEENGNRIIAGKYDDGSTIVIVGGYAIYGEDSARLIAAAPRMKAELEVYKLSENQRAREAGAATMLIGELVSALQEALAVHGAKYLPDEDEHFWCQKARTAIAAAKVAS